MNAWLSDAGCRVSYPEGDDWFRALAQAHGRIYSDDNALELNLQWVRANTLAAEVAARSAQLIMQLGR
jgi:hypothetical protein